MAKRETPAVKSLLSTLGWIADGGGHGYTLEKAQADARAEVEKWAATNPPPVRYSAEWLEELDADRLDHHPCGLCGFMTFYFLKPQVAFNSGCNCAWSPPRPSSFQEIAEWLNMQRSDDIRENILQGLHPPLETT